MEDEARRQREAQRRAQERAEAEERARQAEQRRVEEAERLRRRFTEAIEALTAQITFASRQQWVGRRPVGERAIGHVLEEGEIPDAGHVIRPLQGMHEIGALLPEEFAYDEDDFYTRLGLGDSLVSVAIERRVVRETVYEDVYKNVIQVVYILIDISGSMFQEAWRTPIWKAVLRRIVAKARERGAVVMLRPFSDRIFDLQRAETARAYVEIEHFIDGLSSGGGTNLGLAIDTATQDVAALEFDHADIVIVSDGEDDKFDPEGVRRNMDRHGIGLRAIMLGANNAGLRSCADAYQVIDRDLNVSEPFTR